MVDRIEAWLRMRDASRFQRDARESGRAVRDIGNSAVSADKQMGLLERTSRRVGSGIRSLGAATWSLVKNVGLLAGAGAAAGAALGIKFNANMEQLEVAFSNFLGSTGKARTYLNDLYQIAAKTPFEFPELAAAARKFLAFGFAADDTKKILMTVGDTISGIGGGAEEIERITLSLGQIQAKGRLQSEELLQLAELGIPAYKILRKQLGLTGTELSKKLQAGAIDADTAIKALTAGMDEAFGGSSQKQARTFTGQLSTMKDQANLFVGTITGPLFNKLRTDVLPALNKGLGALLKGYKKGGWQGAISELDDVSGAGGRLSRAWDRIKNSTADARAAVKDWIKGGGIKRAWEDIKDAIRPLSPLIDKIMDALGNPVVQKVLITLVALGAAFKAVNFATMGAAGAVGRFTLSGLELTSSIVTAIGQLLAYRAAKVSLAIANMRAAGSTAVDTTATNVNALAHRRSLIGLLAQRAGIIATAAATRVAAAGQWLWNAAMMANPIGLVIIAIVAIVAALVFAYKKFGWFRDAVNAIWGAIKDAASAVFNFIKDHWRTIVGILGGPFGIAIGVISKHFEAIKNVFKSVYNWIASKWNNFGVHLPEVKAFGKVIFPGINLDTPDIPLLGTGGIVTSGGTAIVGDDGPELARHTARGTVITPLAKTGTASALSGTFHIHLDAPVIVGGREVARATADQTADWNARKGRSG